MLWQNLATFTLDNDWQLSEPTSSTVFRLHHSFDNPNKYQVVAIAALANQSSQGIEIFSSQRINPKSELEIIQFPSPPTRWNYSFGIKQVLLPKQSLIQWSLSVDMPLIPINPPEPANLFQSSSFTASTANVTTTAVKVLSANPNRKQASFYNPDSSKTVYLDVTSALTTTVAALAIPPGNAYISDLNWIGDVYAVVKTGTVTIQIREFT